jgi:hypothetical protein
MTSRRVRLAVAAVLAVGLVGTSIALAAGASSSGRKEDGNLRAKLVGFQEVPALNTPGHADFTATMTNTQITFKLVYADLTGPPSAAHIHVGQRGVNGGVSVFFCGGGGKPACPASNSGTVSGTIVAADVLGPTTQGFNTGDLAAVERAIRAGVTYANMHTAKFPGGEIRGQIRAHGDDNGKDEHSGKKEGKHDK